VRRLRVVLGDQLSHHLPSLVDAAPDDVILLAEVMGECTYVPHHKQKIALVLSAMRHFAEELRAAGLTVRYVTLDDAANTQSLTGEVERACAELDISEVITTAAGEHRVRELQKTWPGVEIFPDKRFATPTGWFARWAAGKTTLRMEFFYREMRRHHRLLMEGDKPAGGEWNYDAENRRKLPKGTAIPAPKRFAPDATTQAVLELVRQRFGNQYGSLQSFDYPMTAADAQAGFEDFLTHRLASYGDWQDAMATDEPYLFHSLISAPLNLGLLDPLALCRAAEQKYREGRAPLNAVEGFIRQIIGWREFIRGIYDLHMPRYATLNALDATRKLPDFYWTGDTKMHCMAQAIGQTLEHAYAHHIQRLMITGNFALLAGLHPDAVDEWYLAVYADAYEWVEMPNTRGMALHADGGIVGSKPYAASGAYINRMSDYCGTCHYNVAEPTGARACPFNALYWDFIARHAQRFANNPRMAMPVRSWNKFAAPKQKALRDRAAEIFALMEDAQL
jgi:deoxyribodipyrimidine photolyase-related protein